MSDLYKFWLMFFLAVIALAVFPPLGVILLIIGVLGFVGSFFGGLSGIVARFFTTRTHFTPTDAQCDAVAAAHFESPIVDVDEAARRLSLTPEAVRTILTDYRFQNEITRLGVKRRLAREAYHRELCTLIPAALVEQPELSDDDLQKQFSLTIKQLQTIQADPRYQTELQQKIEQSKRARFAVAIRRAIDGGQSIASIKALLDRKLGIAFSIEGAEIKLSDDDLAQALANVRQVERLLNSSGELRTAKVRPD